MRSRIGVVLAIIVLALVGMIRLAAQVRAGREDCAPYNPSALKLTEERGHWLISRDDGARFMVLDTKEDADVMMGVFGAHSALCYVGRNNERPDRERYVQHYWK
jgi:hypothetical protein